MRVTNLLAAALALFGSAIPAMPAGKPVTPCVKGGTSVSVPFKLRIAGQFPGTKPNVTGQYLNTYKNSLGHVALTNSSDVRNTEFTFKDGVLATATYGSLVWQNDGVYNSLTLEESFFSKSPVKNTKPGVFYATPVKNPGYNELFLYPGTEKAGKRQPPYHNLVLCLSADYKAHEVAVMVDAPTEGETKGPDCWGITVALDKVIACK